MTDANVSVRWSWRSSLAVGVVIEMVEDLAYDARLGDESHDAESASTRTQKGVDFENSSNQIRPAPPQCLFSGGARGRLVFMWVRSSRIVLLIRLASSSNGISVVAVIEEQMSPRLWNLSDHSCQELERVDFFDPREKLTRLVVRGFGSVEDVSGGFGPFQSGKSHWGSKHVASDFFERVLFARGDAHGIVDGEATSLP